MRISIYTKVQSLLQKDYEPMMEFSMWMLDKNEEFLEQNLGTDESLFTNNGIFNRHSNHLYYYHYYYYLVCWLTSCTPKQKPIVNGVIQYNSSKGDCVPVTGNAQLNL
jgi:hypothetical protein